jgi:carboxypeptidase family protein
MGTSSTKTTKRTTRKTKRTCRLLLDFVRAPYRLFGRHTQRCMLFLILSAVLMASGVIATPTRATAQNQPSQHANDFVIFASVFTQQGFSLPGAKVRVRRVDEKKFRWEAMSDRRGELGVRVKQGAEYELTIEAIGFKPETRKIDAREGNREDLTFQLEPVAGGKP